MEYAVVEIAGKQYRVKPGDTLEVDNLKKESGSVLLDRVLLTVNGEDIKIGKPYVDGVSVSAKLIENFRGNKLRVARFTAKSRHRRVVGFRASLSRIQIEKIVAGGSKSAVSKTTQSTKRTRKTK